MAEYLEIVLATAPKRHWNCTGGSIWNEWNFNSFLMIRLLLRPMASDNSASDELMQPFWRWNWNFKAFLQFVFRNERNWINGCWMSRMKMEQPWRWKRVLPNLDSSHSVTSSTCASTSPTPAGRWTDGRIRWNNSLGSWLTHRLLSRSQSARFHSRWITQVN